MAGLSLNDMERNYDDSMNRPSAANMPNKASFSLFLDGQSKLLDELLGEIRNLEDKLVVITNPAEPEEQQTADKRVNSSQVSQILQDNNEKIIVCTNLLRSLRRRIDL